MTRPNITTHDALTGTTEVREMTEEEYTALLESGWTEETPGERSASDIVEEEGSQNAPIPDSGSAPSDN